MTSGSPAPTTATSGLEDAGTVAGANEAAEGGTDDLRAERDALAEIVPEDAQSALDEAYALGEAAAERRLLALRAEVCGERFGATGVCDMPKGHAPIAEVMGWMHSETVRGSVSGGGEQP